MINGNDIALHNADFGDFIKTLDHCKGDVFLETADGTVSQFQCGRSPSQVGY